MSPSVRDGRGRRETYETELGGSGSGPVERRLAGDAERSGFAPRVVSPGLPRAPARVARAEDLTPAQADVVVALVNADRAERGEPLIHLADPPVTTVTPVTPVTTPEEPPMAIERAPLEPQLEEPEPVAAREPLGDSLQILADAAASAAAAWSTMQGAGQASRVADAELARAETAWDGARAALEASWRATGIGMIDLLARVVVAAEVGAAAGRVDALGLDEHPDVVAAMEAGEGELASLVGYVPPSRIQEVLDRRAARDDDAAASTESPTDIPEIIPAAEAELGRETADDAPEVVTRRESRDVADAATAADLEAERTTKAAREAGGGPGLPRQQERILERVAAMRGDRKAAATALGLSIENVNGALHSIGKKGLLPIDLISMLPAGFAKYSPAVG